MAIWYELEPSEQGIDTFLDCNWGLHDFRLENISYSAGRDYIDVFLKYDTGDQGRLLRFAGIRKVSIKVDRDYEADWIFDSRIFLTDHHSMVWVEDSCDTAEDCKEQLDEIRDYTTWVEADRIFWAITDPNGKPVETPPSIIDQIWEIYGKEERHHFDLKPYTGNMDTVLKTDYARDRRHV